MKKCEGGCAYSIDMGVMTLTYDPQSGKTHRDNPKSRCGGNLRLRVCHFCGHSKAMCGRLTFFQLSEGAKCLRCERAKVR